VVVAIELFILVACVYYGLPLQQCFKTVKVMVMKFSELINDDIVIMLDSAGGSTLQSGGGKIC